MTKAETFEMVIPTYQRGEDSPYPPLGFGVRRNGYTPYPYSLQDDADIGPGGLRLVPDMRHKAVRLSNGILEAIVLPGLHGRVHSLRNLATGRELLYRNNVVKPSLVAIRGAWISGGIEFNFPSLGHSVSAVSPVFHHVEDGGDEAAVIVGDIDLCTRQWWQVRISLKQGRAALDIETTLTNPNPHRERLYYWENAAVPAADDLRLVCDAPWTVGGGIEPWPLRGGVDKSYYVNNHAPVDHFSYRQNSDFFGAYYEGSRRGVYRLGFRHRTEGRKFFSWGTGPDNKVWERFLTDKDGQYIEVQTGIFESQSITGWLDGGGSVSFKGSWFGTEGIGVPSWANGSAAAAVGEEGGAAVLDIHSIELAGEHRVAVSSGGQTRESVVAFMPGEARRIDVGPERDFSVEIFSPRGRLLFSESPRPAAPERLEISPRDWERESLSTPEAKKAEEFVKYHNWRDAARLLRESADKLPAAARHGAEAEINLKTNRLAEALESVRAWLDADPGDQRAHLTAAAIYARKFRLEGSPEVLWRLRDHCMASRRSGKLPAAAVALMAAAEILEGKLLYAGELLADIRAETAGDVALSTLAAGIRRKTGDAEGFQEIVGKMPGLWPHRAGETYLRHGDAGPLRDVLAGFGADTEPLQARLTNMLLEWLLVYWRAGWHDDLSRLAAALSGIYPAAASHPLYNLLLADAAERCGRDAEAEEHRRAARSCPVRFVFPKRWEEEWLLSRWTAPADGYLPALCAIENGRPEAGVAALRSFLRDGNGDSFARKAALAVIADWESLTPEHSAQERRALLEAHSIGAFDRRLFLRLDAALRAAQDIKLRTRLAGEIPAELADRGDVALRRACLELDRDNAELALEILAGHRFNQFEGQSSARRLYVDCLLTSGLRRFIKGDLAVANERFLAVMEHPENIGSPGNLGEHSRLARFMLGLTARRRGEAEAAQATWRTLLQGSGEDNVYVVPGAAQRREVRADELGALALAAKSLKDEVKLRALAKRAAAEREIPFALLTPLLKGRWPAFEAAAEDALRKSRCNPVVRIIALLGKALAAEPGG